MATTFDLDICIILVDLVDIANIGPSLEVPHLGILVDLGGFD